MAQHVRVEVEEGRAYTYTWDDSLEPPLEPGEAVVLPGNIVHGREFEGRVVRTMTAEQVAADPYQGEYKAVLRRVEQVAALGELSDEDLDLL